MNRIQRKDAKTQRRKRGINFGIFYAPLRLCAFALISAALFLSPGCARFSTRQSDTSYENGQPVRTITTRATSTTFFDSQSALAKFKAIQTDKSQSASVGSLNQEASGTNAALLVESVTKGAIEGALRAIAPKP